MRPEFALAPHETALAARLERLLARAAPGDLLSLSIDLGPGVADWLAAAPRTPEFCYWSRPERGEYRLGLGRAMICASAGPSRFTALQAAWNGIERHWHHDDGDGLPPPVACLGFAFDPESSDALPNAQLGIPAVLLRSLGGRRMATFTTAAREAGDALARWRTLLATRPLRPPPRITRADSALAPRAWRARVAAALAEIASGRLEKVVLARELALSATQPPEAMSLLAALGARQPHARVFAMGCAGAIFLGATPERLVRLRAGQASADALAATQWSADGTPDTLLEDDKSRHEQAVVTGAVAEALAPLLDTVRWPAAPRVIRAGPLRHLWTPVGGPVRPGVGLFDLAARLHPTPAVGGAPDAAARDWLRRHGERRAAWYSGGIGWIAPGGDGEIAVALRCALIEGRRIRLQAGAGIVAGSDPARESEEIEAKFGIMLDALRASEGQAAGRTWTPRTGTGDPA